MDQYQQRKSKTRNCILDAGWELFREHGVTDSKVTDICALAGITKKTFFNHFPTKDDLVYELGKKNSDELLETITGLRSTTTSTQQRIEGIFLAIAERMKASGAIHPEFMFSLLHSGEYGSNTGAYIFKDIFVTIASEGISRGDIPAKMSAEAVGNAIFGFWFALNFTRAYEGHTVALKQLQAAPVFIAAAISGSQQ